jgi:hypothetical protein
MMTQILSIKTGQLGYRSVSHLQRLPLVVGDQLLDTAQVGLVHVSHPSLPDQVRPALVTQQMLLAGRLELELPVPPWTHLHQTCLTIFTRLSRPL